MIDNGYLHTGNKVQCFGCEACAQACVNHAITIVSDDEGFRYPKLDSAKCINCGLCRKVCPSSEMPAQKSEPIYTWGGYSLNADIRSASTSGGLFSAIVDANADEDTIIFGAEANGLDVRHCWIKGTTELSRFRKSKYLQSEIGSSFADAKRFIFEGKRVIFSGTPCQIAALRKFLDNVDQSRLLAIEVVCEGVPSPTFIQKFADWLGRKLGGNVESLDYRYKDGRKWDFEVMLASLQNPTRGIFKWKQDRWFNPFWSIWLQHLMSRPSCYQCPFATRKRYADISLGDLWGVHLYCPELYGHNGGCSVVFCNTLKGKLALEKTMPNLYGHELATDIAIRYQGPMRNHFAENPRRAEFMSDLKTVPYENLVRKWAKRPTLKLLWQKYVWGNRQKVWLWNLFHKRSFEQ